MWSMMWDFLSQMLFMVLSVVNSSSFPKPLSAKEEREAVAAMAAGDRTARQRLIEHNLRLVAHIAKKYRGDGRDTDDLISIGAFRALKDRGLEVPGDVSVIGFDGLPLGEYLVPRLSTVDQPTTAMARRGLELLLDSIEKKNGMIQESILLYLICQHMTD